MIDQIHQGKWRDLQQTCQQQTKRRSLMQRLPRLGLYAGSSFLMTVIVFYATSWIFAHLENTAEPFRSDRVKRAVETEALTKSDLPEILRHLDVNKLLNTGSFQILRSEGLFTFETFIDGDLQGYVLDLLSRSLTQEAAVVVLRPDTGEILAMVHYEKEGSGQNGDLCLKADYPAASLFKIVSASAAIEAQGFTPESKMAFRGGKYTLYKSQLRKEEGKGSAQISFKQAFSASINPVFGKIGIHYLGREIVADYADKFFFNTPIPFDLPMGSSPFQVPDDDFGLAEIASGFNKRTLISPLHAALIASAIANDGIIMAPSLVKLIRDPSGTMTYHASIKELGRPITKATARKMQVLMEETVENGTCQRAFRPLQGKRSFKDLSLGAKTGTINDQTDQYKVDWLSAYAIPSTGGQGICVAVLAVHGEKLGIRAKDMARYIIKHHFRS